MQFGGRHGFCSVSVRIRCICETALRVKSGKVGRSAKFGQLPCFFHILIIVIKNIKLANSGNPDETAH